MEVIKSPFPYFGGKSKVAAEVWARFGDVVNVVEPFFGSGAVLLARPEPWRGTETVNDLDGLLSNFWRAVQADPDAVAAWADNPVNENDLHARHSWLVNRKETMQAKLEGDPDFYDAKIAGWWVWGIACWIGGGWCAGTGPWTVVDGELVKGNAGQGIKRQLPHLKSAGGGVICKRLGGWADKGVNAIGDLQSYMQAISDRMRRVRVCCGDWSRVCGPTPTIKNGLTAVFLDPPYSHAVRDKSLYTTETDCSAAVREWAIANGDNPLMRIALCGYSNEHTDMPDDWECVAWNAGMGYGSQAEERTGNGKRERIWYSPHCIKPTAKAQGMLSILPDAALNTVFQKSTVRQDSKQGV